MIKNSKRVQIGFTNPNAINIIELAKNQDSKTVKSLIEYAIIYLLTPSVAKENEAYLLTIFDKSVVEAIKVGEDIRKLLKVIPAEKGINSSKEVVNKKPLEEVDLIGGKKGVEEDENIGGSKDKEYPM